MNDAAECARVSGHARTLAHDCPSAHLITWQRLLRTSWLNAWMECWLSSLHLLFAENFRGDVPIDPRGEYPNFFGEWASAPSSYGEDMWKESGRGALHVYPDKPSQYVLVHGMISHLPTWIPHMICRDSLRVCMCASSTPSLESGKS